MPSIVSPFATLEEWVARESISFDVDGPPQAFNAAVDQIVQELGDAVELLGIGEPTHGDEQYLVLRNRLFQRLVESHGYTAITVESSFPRSPLVNAYVSGDAGPAASYDDIQEAGFSHGFGSSAANRELVEWMRSYNTSVGGHRKLRFYGFDGPMEMTGTDSPRQSLRFVLNYLVGIDRSAVERRKRIEELLGENAAWENPAAMMDPTKSIGLTPAAAALRIEIEDLITELSIRRPELIAASDRDLHLEALQHAKVARELLNYHAGLARSSQNRIAELLGIRDAMMADNLVYALQRERGRGKVLAFAQNMHLKRGLAQWQLGPHALKWWPAGAHVASVLDERYAMIGVAAGASAHSGLEQPERGTLEAILATAPGTARFVPTHLGDGLPADSVASLATRSVANPGYFPFSAQSIADFDALILLG
jgi:erythromycin esterase-like protein